MRFEKLLALIVSGAMAVSMLPAPALAVAQRTPAAAPVRTEAFTDIANHWGAASIDRWTREGIITGVGEGKFCPDGNLTRAALAAILSKLLGLTAQAENTYADVKGDEWYADAVLRCTAAGIMKGDGNHARPMAEVSRQESMVMIARALGIKPAETAELSAFQDGGAAADWAAPYLTVMVQKGLLTGVGEGLVAPEACMSRAAVMTVLDKAISTYVNKAGEYELESRGLTVVAVPDVVLKGGQMEQLLIAPGVGTGKVTLNGTNVSGSITVRGGILAGSGGTMGAVQVDTDTPVTLQAAQLQSVVITAQGAKLTVDAASRIGTLTAERAGAAITNFGRIETLYVGKNAAATKYVAGEQSRMPKLVTENRGGLTLTTVEEEQRLADEKPVKNPPQSDGTQALKERMAFTGYLAQTNYTGASWAAMTAARAMAESTPTEQAAKLAALEGAMSGLVMTPSAQAGVDQLSSKMQRYFQGQNDSALHAVTLHLDSNTRTIGICVFQPDVLLMLAMQGSGMKSAFTEEPVLHITAQDGTHVSLLTANDERDAIGAAIGLAEAIGTRYGVDAYAGKLADILAQPEQLRDMQVMFGCGSTETHTAPTEYSGVYTLQFYQSPLRLQQTDCTLAQKAALQLRPIAAPTGPLTWVSSNPSVAAVDQNGVVTGVGKGTATISMGAVGYTGFPAQTLVTVGDC